LNEQCRASIGCTKLGNCTKTGASSGNSDRTRSGSSKGWKAEAQFQIGGDAVGWDSWGVAMSGDTAVFGAPHDKNCTGAGKKRTCIQPGSVFVFR